MRTLVLIALLSVASCATLPLTEEEEFVRDYNRSINRENWALCEKVYREWGEPTHHKDHTHPSDGKGVKEWMINNDLFDNQCRQILGEYWAKGMQNDN